MGALVTVAAGGTAWLLYSHVIRPLAQRIALPFMSDVACPQPMAPGDQPMFPSVRDDFIAFNRPFEAYFETMYVDVENLVTGGVGNLIDPVERALCLPFVRYSDGQPATQAEIRAEWQRVKSGGFAQEGARAAARGATIHLAEDTINGMVLGTFDANAVYLGKHFDFSTMPADGQLCLASMAYAMGAGKLIAQFLHFIANVQDGNWAQAATNCDISTTGNPGVGPRNIADRLCCANAAAVLAAGSDLSVLWYPGSAPADA